MKSRLRNSHQLESLEARQLLAADLIFKTTPYDHDANAATAPQPFQFSFESLDFLPGNALIRDYDQLQNGQTAELLYQAVVTDFIGVDGNPVANNGGLGTDYEVTAVMRATISRDLNGRITLFAPQGSDAFGFELYYDNLTTKYEAGATVATKADALSGKGYDDGRLILSGDVARLFENPVLIINPDSAGLNFDSFGPNNYSVPLIKSIFAQGSLLAEVDVTFVDTNYVATNYGTLTASDFSRLQLSMEALAPFFATNPSREFFGNAFADVGAGVNDGKQSFITPDIGLVNGQNGDFQFQADASMPVTLRPGSIHGFKFEDLNANGVRDVNDPPLGGVQFQLIVDTNRNGVLDAGETKVVQTTTSQAGTGEFHFEGIIPGHYIVREVPNTPTNEVKPSTHTTVGILVCAGEEHVWAPGAAGFRYGEVESYVFYNNSYYDSAVALPAGTAAQRNWNAVATDKSPLLANSVKATYANYTNYVRGLNGIVIELPGTESMSGIGVSDFEFRMISRDLNPTIAEWNQPSLWVPAPSPSAIITDSSSGNDRVFIEWADGAIKNAWLEVRVKATGNTRILSDEVFYWGNQIAETNSPSVSGGNPFAAQVDGVDVSAVVNNPLGFATTSITTIWDLDRNKQVDGADVSIAVNSPSAGIVLPTIAANAVLPPGIWHLPGDEQAPNPLLTFGNYVVGSIHGFKYNDYEGDGVYNPNGWDLPFGGIEFQLHKYNTATETYQPVPGGKVTTDHGGEFWFTGLTPGLYKVQELQPAWADVMPSPGNTYWSREIEVLSRQEHVWKAGAAMLPPTTETLRHEVLVNPNTHGIDEGLIFGNFVKGSIHGFKFEDMNGNGTYEPNSGEVPWAGVKFELWRDTDKDSAITGADTLVDTKFTVADGGFDFTGVIPGWYVLREVLFPAINVEYVPSTLPTDRPLFVGSREELVYQHGAANLPSGALQHEILFRADPHLPNGPKGFNGPKELVFGNYIPGSIHGFKFEDLNGNGIRDAIYNDAGGFVAWADPPMANVTIFLTGKDGMNNDVVQTTVTNADGEFWFMNLKPGVYTVNEKAAPVGFDNDDTPTLVGFKDQGELLNGNGQIAFPVDNVMMSGTNSATFTIRSRQEYVWRPGAGHFEDFCFRDNPGLVQITGENANLTHVLCNGEMATHTVKLNVPMPADAYHVAELEVMGLNGGSQAAKDGMSAKWTSGTYVFGAPGVGGVTGTYTNYTSNNAHPLTGTGLKFEIKIEAGKVLATTQTSVNTNSLTPNFVVTNPVSAVNVSGSGLGSGFKVNVTVNAAGTPSWTVADQGINYVPGDVVKIPFGLIGGQTPSDDIIIRIDSVESKIVDLKPTGASPLDNPDTFGPDANVLMGGKAYEIGDMFTIQPLGSVVGDVLSINASPVSQGTGYGSPGLPTPMFTYVGVSVNEAGGLKLNVTVDTNPASPTFEKVLSVAIHTPGTGYAANQLVTLNGLALGAGSNDDVKVRINTVGDDRIMLKVVEVGNTTLDVTLMEMSDDWGQSEVTTANPVVIDSLTGGNPTQEVTFTLKLTGKGYDDRIDYLVKVDGVNFPGDLFVDSTNVGPTFHVGINNGTLREEILSEGLVFANFVKGSIHGYKFHDRNLDGIENGNDEPFNGVEFSLADSNGNLLLPDFTFSGGIVLPAGTDASDYRIHNGRGTGTSTHGTWAADAGAHNTPGSALSEINNGNKTESFTLLAFTPFSAGVGFSKMVQGQAGDTLSFYIDDVLQGTWSGSDNKFTDAWYEGPRHGDGTADGWGWHKYTWTFNRAADVADNPTGRAWIDDIRFTAMTGANSDLPGEFWFEDVSPGNYVVKERLDLVGQFQGEVMPSFMNVSQWAATATASSQYDVDGDANDMLASHATGAPDDKGWSASVKDKHMMGLEWLILNYSKPVFASSVVVDGVPGFATGVTKIEINNVADGTWHQVPANGILHAMPDFMSDKVRLTVDTDTVWNEFEKVDAVQLNGMMMTKDQIAVTVQSGQELVWKDGAAMLPDDMCGPAPVDGDVVFVIDVSGSTTNPFTGANVGDLNGDTIANSILDAQIAAYIALNNQLKLTNPNANVAIVAFQNFSLQLDMSTVAGVQLSTKPGTDANLNGVSDVEDILRSLTASGATDFEEALQDTINTIQTAPLTDVTVVFMSDGFHNVGPTTDYVDEVATLNGLGVTLRAFGVGNDASLAGLQVIDPGAMIFTDPTELENFFGGQNGGNHCPDTTLREEKNVGNDLVFANLVKGSIHAFKFEDIDADGVYETGSDQDPTKPGDQFDRPWAGFVFELYTKNFFTGEYTVLRDTEVSNANGEVWFTGLKPGEDYRLVEKGPNFAVNAGDTIGSSTGDAVLIPDLGSGVELAWKQGAAMLDANSPSVKDEIVVSEALMFGNYVRGSIHGFKFEDYRGDGIYSPSDNDKPFGGIKFDLQKVDGPNSTTGTPVTSQVTNKDGEFWFTDLVPGWYRIREDYHGNPLVSTTHAEGAWTYYFVGSRQELAWKPGAAMLPTTPDVQRQELVIGTDLYYGNAVTGSIHGFKCEDVDADGKCETTGHVVFVIDASDTMQGPIVEIELGDPHSDADDIPGNQNPTQDALFNRKFDAQIVALANLLSQLPAMPGNADIQVGVVVMRNGVATQLDVSPAAGTQLFNSSTNPTQILDAVKGLLPAGDTNFQAALNSATSLLASVGAEPHRANVYFLSDGFPNVGDTGNALADEVAALAARAGNIVAAGIGQDSTLSSLQVIDAEAVKYPTMAALQGITLGTNFKLPELPMAGVDFVLTGTTGLGVAVGPITVPTGPNGEFEFLNLFPGTYTVTEQLPAGWASSTGTTWTKQIGSREEFAWGPGQANLPVGSMKVEILDTKLVFGNYIPGAIHGFKFDDLDADGVYEAGESYMGGVAFQLYRDGSLVDTKISGLFNGRFSFTNLKPGSYEVREVDVAGDDIVPTTHTSTFIELESGQAYVWSTSIGVGALQTKVLADGDDDPGNDPVDGFGRDLIFGNTILGSIHGFKYEDYRGDGIYNSTRVAGAEGNLTDGIDNDGDGFIDNAWLDRLPNRPGLQIQEDLPWANFPFEITGDFDGDGIVTTITTTTNANGQFDRTGLYPGTYVIREMLELLPSDVVAISPAQITVTILSGQELVWNPGAAGLAGNALQTEVVDLRLAFANAYKGSIHGCVFLDTNGNGTQQGGETTQNNVPVHLYNSTAGGTKGSLVGTKLTQSLPGEGSGHYWFTGLTPGWYLVEVDPAAASMTTAPHLMFVGSREELVHRDGVANLGVGANQHEVNVSGALNPFETLVGIQAPTAPAAIAGALFGLADDSTGGSDANAVDMLLATEADEPVRRSVDVSSVARSGRRAWVGEQTEVTSLVDDAFASLEDEDELIAAFVA